MNAQQLKNAILQEAIEGRLVPQDPNDEPASALLERIRKEKEELVKAGKLKKKDLEVKPISEDEIPFEIPEGWEWVRLVDIGIAETGTTPSKSHPEYFGTFIPFLGPANILNGQVISETQGLSELGANYGRIVPKGSILQVCIGGSIGKCAIVDKPVTFNQQINSITPLVCVIEFIYYVLQSDYFRLAIKERSTGTATPIINRGNWEQLTIPLPPLAEQHRIVAKIEELLPKVEEYGKAQDALNKLNAELPERLKKSILQEAIEGRLVPQDPNDEPASVLLAKIRKEKEELVKAGKLKKKDLIETPITEDEIPFEIPESWEWVRLGALVSNQTGLSYNKGDLEKKVDNSIRVLRGGNIQNGSWCTKVDDVMIAPEYVKKPNLTLQKNTFITPAVTSLEHLGKTALIEEDYTDIVAGGFVLYLLPFYRDDIFSKYLSYYFQSAYYNTFCQSIANKSGQAFWNLSRQKLMELVLPIPPLAEQHRIVEKLEQVLGDIDKLRK
ncbi:restriction endonuclease subunit S [uncultured Prevotella sp.]|uniref:restriction endonuclease subunit S n=1 Tax=uncultured Prevotella sp. TaxID=159272 RepID=UPI00258CE018|nr:restriction endonuclease subunit S [uncultured Prevotella sp.]